MNLLHKRRRSILEDLLLQAGDLLPIGVDVIEVSELLSGEAGVLSLLAGLVALALVSPPLLCAKRRASQ